MKKYMIFSFVAGIILILLGVGIFIGTEQNEKNMRDAANTTTIVNGFNAFKEQALLFSNERSRIYAELFDVIIISEIPSQKQYYDETFNNYLNIVKELDNVSSDLKELCPNHTYKDKDLVSKCSSFITAYETSINYFIKDINTFNSNFELYNDRSDVKLELYSTEEYKDFIDYNGDGIYLGRD